MSGGVLSLNSTFLATLDSPADAFPTWVVPRGGSSTGCRGEAPARRSPCASNPWSSDPGNAMAAGYEAIGAVA